MQNYQKLIKKNIKSQCLNLVKIYKEGLVQLFYLELQSLQKSNLKLNNSNVQFRIK